MREVTLSDMLAAREQRAAAQQALLRQYSCPVVSFSMNIAGSLKDDPLIRRAFSRAAVCWRTRWRNRHIPSSFAA